MTLTEFKTRAVKDLQHAKRLKLWREGHTDEEMAIACKVSCRVISRWRKEYGLSQNIVLHIRSREDRSERNSNRLMKRSRQGGLTC